VLSLAFLAGLVAAFNPCGFVLLPAYLASIILANDVNGTRWMYHARAIKFSLGMALGFVGVFGGFALLLSSISSSIVKFLPAVTVIVGIVLMSLSLSLIRGKTLMVRKLVNPNIAPTPQWLSQIGYGVSFALASLSCTVGPFLAITAAAITRTNVLSILTLFLVYSIGMGSVVLVLSLLVTTAKSGLINKLKRSQGRVTSASGYLLLIVGIYETWYGWYEIRVLRGNNASDPFVSSVISVQSKITQWISTFGIGSIILSILLITASLLVFGVKKGGLNPPLK
jgi:cytochrome c-type biogenesis protein